MIGYSNMKFLSMFSEKFGKKLSIDECLLKVEEEYNEMVDELDFGNYTKEFKSEVLDLLQATVSLVISLQENKKLTKQDICEWKNKQKQRIAKYTKEEE